MEARRCGNSAIVLPVLGVGCWAFGGGSYWGAQDERDVDAVVSAALERGCAFFDTAEGYNEGRSEEALGRALRGRREKALVASKISPDHCAPGLVRKHCEASLARLGTDYLDLYLIHWPINPVAIRHFTGESPGEPALPSLPAALAELDTLRREGKIRAVGLSNFGVHQLADAVASGFPLACDELPYSLLTRAVEWELLAACSRHGLGVFAYMPLMQGLLTGKYRAADELPPNRARTRHFRADRPGVRHGETGFERETFDAVDALRALAASEGVPLERLAIAWSVAHTDIICTITGARNAAQLEENARAAELTLAPALVAEMDAVTEKLKRALGRTVDLYEAAASTRTY